MYPLTRPFLYAALVTGIVGCVIFGSLIAGFAWFTLFAVLALVWRADEPPILSFALGFQWIFVVAGFFYTELGGELKDDVLSGDVRKAIAFSMFGFLSSALGIRLGISSLGDRIAAVIKPSATCDVSLLFRVTVIAYSISWVIDISPKEIFFNGAQILNAALAVREMLFCLLWLVIIKRWEGWKYGMMALVVAFVPRLVSKQSGFKELLFMLVVIILTEWRPWVSEDDRQRRRNYAIGTAVATAAVALSMLGVIWEGGIKPVWRTLEVGGTQMDRLRSFVQVTRSAVHDLDEEQGIKALISRISSINQFSLVLENVPESIQHEGGRLTKRALVHILIPRILHPEKESLGTDSWLAEEYAGVTVGEDTSVGIGYMAEFYVDWGVLGLVGGVFVMGFLFGLAYGLAYLWSPNHLIASALVVVTFMGSFTTYEATLPKLLGGFIVNLVFLLAAARSLPVLLSHRMEPPG